MGDLVANKAKWQNSVIKQDASIVDAIRALDDAQMQIALVIGEDGQLVGSVTDGDIRRAILHGVDLKGPAETIMSKEPITASAADTKQQLIAHMRSEGLQHLPIIDGTGRLIGLETLMGLVGAKPRSNTVVLMAGGFGRRLKERTHSKPKPLLNIGGKPILETIIENFIEQGFGNFIISVGYLSDQIKSYFADGSKWGTSISYIEEDKPLGTAGALSLLSARPSESFFVMNGDVLTKVNYSQLLRFHHEHDAQATMCVRGLENQVPYGVVTTEGVEISSIEEKPVQTVMVNAGIYVLDPSVLDIIPHNQNYDMPSMFTQLIENKQKTAAYPVHEYWMDVGQPNDFTQADEEYNKIFKEV